MTSTDNQSEIIKDRTVSPCFCCPMTYKEFYSFINISDIIGCIIGLIIALIMIILDFSISILAICLTIIWLITAIIAFCTYKPKYDFRKPIHKFYAILRGLICILDIVFMTFLLKVVIFDELHKYLRPIRVLLIILVIILLLISVLNFYWSVLFIEVVFSSADPANKVIDQSEDLSNELADSQNNTHVSQESQDEENQKKESPFVS